VVLHRFHHGAEDAVPGQGPSRNEILVRSGSRRSCPLRRLGTGAGNARSPSAVHVSEPVRQWILEHPEPGGAGTEFRALAHDAGEAHGPGFGAGAGCGRCPVGHYGSVFDQKDVALVRPVVHLGFKAVEMLPPELLALPAVVARGGRDHRHCLFVSGELTVVRK
jgi:hypothetical protein